MKIIKYIFLTIISIVTILILWVNVSLHSGNYTPAEKKADIISQLKYLESELKNNNLGGRMQKVYPEGFVFSNVLYGLTWCELALSDKNNDPALKEKAVREALYAYNEINSDIAKSTFDKSLLPEYGIFYVGWKNYLLSKILSVDTTFAEHKFYSDTFAAQCDLINDNIKGVLSPYLQSYSGQAWPVDMFVAMTSLKNYDKIYVPKYESDIAGWMLNVKRRLDPATLMIPHKVDTKNGRSAQGTRGSSMSLILRMLAEIDMDYAKEQYKLFESKFVSTTFGLPSVLEYPEGQKGSGDIDSGPVIFGVGFSGTIVSIGTFSVMGNSELSEKQFKTVNAFGFSNSFSNEKKYLFGKVPIADAFIAWGRASGLKNQESAQNYSSSWTVKFHIISFFIIAVLWAAYFIGNVLRRKRTISN
ncbi:MAG: hypothetical protein PHN88_03625 [Ignavibacteria bacterium]|nr:hypothetical protein [Ignavibacteria bacterium]